MNENIMENEKTLWKLRDHVVGKEKKLSGKLEKL